VAVVENASLPTQRHACACLSELGALFEREQLASPAVIVIGDVLLGLQNLAVADSPNAARQA
jgi:uroporphyrin-III C-methyltransferase